MPGKVDPVGGDASRAAACRSSSASCSSGVQDFLLAADHLRVLLLRYVDPGRRQPACVLLRARRRAARVGVDLARCNTRFRTPVNALLVRRGGHGAVRAARLRLADATTCTSWFITYPANVNALVALVSFGVSGIYLSFLLTVIGAIDRAAPRLGARGPLPARALGLDGVDRRRGLPRPDARQRRRADRADEPARRTSTSTGSRCS